jgi:hypothetical protein
LSFLIDLGSDTGLQIMGTTQSFIFEFLTK